MLPLRGKRKPLKIQVWTVSCLVMKLWEYFVFISAALLITIVSEFFSVNSLQHAELKSVRSFTIFITIPGNARNMFLFIFNSVYTF